MVKIKDGNYIAIFYDKMIEVKADSKRDAYNKAKRYFESREHRELFDNELKVCKIPSMICVLDEWMKRWFHQTGQRHGFGCVFFYLIFLM